VRGVSADTASQSRAWRAPPPCTDARARLLVPAGFDSTAKIAVAVYVMTVFAVRTALLTVCARVVQLGYTCAIGRV
jgi:hypothetical protein